MQDGIRYLSLAVMSVDKTCCSALLRIPGIAADCRFVVTMFMAFVTATLFLRTNLHPDSVTSGQ